MQSSNTQRGRPGPRGIAALGGVLGLATPAAAQGVIATGSGRAGATVAAVVALSGAVTGGWALARSRGRVGSGCGRDGAVVALVLGGVGLALAALHLATTTGGIGTGNGRAGALVALVLGSLGLVLGGLALVRSGRRGTTRASARKAEREKGRPETMPPLSVRYMIDDVPAAVGFYTTLLGFVLDLDASPAFAAVSRDGVQLLLSGEGSSGKRPLADGRPQRSGGWNRIHLRVTNLQSEVARLRGAGVPFRTQEIVTGPAGAQVIIDDPSGNPIELFQPRG